MNLMDVNTLFSTDAKCRELLTRLRFPEGPRCLRCKGPVVELETEKHLFYCKDCDYQFSVTAGTVFNDSHLPLATWFAATLLALRSEERGCLPARFSARSELADIRQHGISATASGTQWHKRISRCSTARSNWIPLMSAG